MSLQSLYEISAVMDDGCGTYTKEGILDHTRTTSLENETSGQDESISIADATNFGRRYVHVIQNCDLNDTTCEREVLA